MRILKLALISVFVFGGILLLLSLLIPSRIRVSRAVNIHAENIVKTIADIKTWKSWNELYSDSARITIVSSSPRSIETVWSHHHNHVPGNFQITTSNGVSVVQWYFEFRLKWYPWEKFGSIVFDKEFGPPMERSLNNLKKQLENSP